MLCECVAHGRYVAVRDRCTRVSYAVCIVGWGAEEVVVKEIQVGVGYAKERVRPEVAPP